MAIDSYTTDYRVERLIYYGSDSTTGSVYTFDNLDFYLTEDYVPYFNYFTTYPSSGGTTVIGSPYNYQPSNFYVLARGYKIGPISVIGFETENYETGTATIQVRAYSEKADG